MNPCDYIDLFMTILVHHLFVSPLPYPFPVLDTGTSVKSITFPPLQKVISRRSTSDQTRPRAKYWRVVYTHQFRLKFWIWHLESFYLV